MGLIGLTTAHLGDSEGSHKRVYLHYCHEGQKKIDGGTNPFCSHLAAIVSAHRAQGAFLVAFAADLVINVSDYELVQLLENAARDTLNQIGAGAAAESALNAQRHKKVLESGAVVAAQILDVEDAARGAASTATQAPAALHRRLLERLLEARRAARSDDAQRRLVHDDPAPGVGIVNVTSGVEAVKIEPTLPAAAGATTPHAEAQLLAATMPPSTPMPPHAEAGSQRSLVLDDPTSGVETVKIEPTLPAAADATTPHTEAPLLAATVPPSTPIQPMPPHAEAGSQRRLVLDNLTPGVEAVKIEPNATTPHAEAPLLAVTVPLSTPMPLHAEAGSPAPFPPDETDGETDALIPGDVGEDTPLVPSNPKRARTYPAAALNEGGAGIYREP